MRVPPTLKAGIKDHSPSRKAIPRWQDCAICGSKRSEERNDYKKSVFQDDADEAMMFFRPVDGNFNFLYRGDINSSKGVSIDVSEPSIRMTLMKVAEIVEIFGPILYARNPIRQVNPREPAEIPSTIIPDPNLMNFLGQQEMVRSQHDALKSQLISTYLNWTPNELHLKDHVSWAIDEALIKGRGCLWCGTYKPPGSNTNYVGSFYDSVDFLYIDPDCESLKDAWWIARKLSQPVWQVERRFGLKPGSLKGHHESANMQSEVDSSRKEFDRQRGMTNDLMIYYEVYSRMGSGGRLSGGNKTRDDGFPLGDSSSFTKVLDPLVGDHVFLVVAPGVRYPLNLPPDVQELPITGTEGPDDGGVLIKERLAWPVPFWADGAWPVSVLDFHPVPRSAWPMSHIKPALGELRFLCWAYSFVSCKIKNTLRDVIAILKEMADQFKLTILEGADLSTVELDTNNRDIRECVQVLQFPPMNADIWRIIQAVEANFEKRVGLDEVRGQQEAQPRSAAQTQAQTQRQNIRPDDMGQKVESWMTEAARKEAISARMLLAPRDVLPILGLTQAALWAQFVMTKDIGTMRELEYRIEAGSTRKPNRDRDQQNADSAMQILLPILNGFAQSTGQLGPVNALLQMWCKTRDIPPGPFMLVPPPPPPMPAPGAAPPGGPPTNGAPAPAPAGAAR